MKIFTKFEVVMTVDYGVLAATNHTLRDLVPSPYL